MGSTYIRQPGLEDPTDLLVYTGRDALHTSTAGETSILELATVLPPRSATRQ